VPLAPVLAAVAASLAGTRVGLGVFARIGDRHFARWVLGCLAASGVVLLCRGLGG